MTLKGFLVDFDATAWRVCWLLAYRHFHRRRKKRLKLDGSIFEDLRSNIAGYGADTRDES